jgi:hypothetical protein
MRRGKTQADGPTLARTYRDLHGRLRLPGAFPKALTSASSGRASVVFMELRRIFMRSMSTSSGHLVSRLSQHTSSDEPITNRGSRFSTAPLVEQLKVNGPRTSDPDEPSEQMRNQPTNQGAMSGVGEVRTLGRLSSSSHQRHRIHASGRQPHHELEFVGPWEDDMANCFAFLRSALSAIEELSVHPGASLTDEYLYDQASASVWVALVALDECDPAVPLGAWDRPSDRMKY